MQDLNKEAPSAMVVVSAGAHLREAEAGSRDSHYRNSNAAADIHVPNSEGEDDDALHSLLGEEAELFPA